MKKFIFTSIILLFLAGCASSDIGSVMRAVSSKDPATAFSVLAKNKSIYYASNPDKLTKDLKFLTDFMNGISGEWGEENVELPKKKEYVKYMQNYKSRAFVDFDAGVVRVETLDTTNTKASLKNAIVTTLLLPDDPRGADLYSAKKVKLGSTPYLLGEVKDDQNKDIRYNWRAGRYADILIKKSYQTKSIKSGGSYKKVAFVEIPMVKDHADIRVSKYKSIVDKYAKKYDISKNLIYAIIQTESNFNQFAVSHAGAYGLMQIVPSSAGIDAYKYAKGKSWKPTKSYLFNAQNNIELGVAYLSILDTKYLKGIYNEISREYCVICAYNTGSGNVLKAFSSNRTRAKEIINSKKPSEVYSSLRSDLKYDEPKHYLKKVVNYKKDFIRL
ncbi:MAG: murein transglycosylase domain-containing protein [Campylobacterota bacterium]|nr:murein transglycosylase domain-containing protein [Campylobacterota bacterium]